MSVSTPLAAVRIGPTYRHRRGPQDQVGRLPMVASGKHFLAGGKGVEQSLCGEIRERFDLYVYQHGHGLQASGHLLQLPRILVGCFDLHNHADRMRRKQIVTLVFMPDPCLLILIADLEAILVAIDVERHSIGDA